LTSPDPRRRRGIDAEPSRRAPTRKLDDSTYPAAPCPGQEPRACEGSGDFAGELGGGGVASGGFLEEEEGG